MLGRLQNCLENLYGLEPRYDIHDFLITDHVMATALGGSRRRIEEELEQRQRRGRPAHPWDRHLIAALESGLPECAGVAAGLERLQMALDKTDDITNVMTFAIDSTDE